MRTIKRTFAVCSIALAGFGIMLIGSSKAARDSAPTLFFTSVTLYLSEAVLFWAFFVGLWWVISRLISVRWASRAGSFMLGVGDRSLRRFALFQVAFVAVWSICFKGVMYTTLDPAYSHYLMAKSQSLGIAIPAEMIILLLVLVGLAVVMFRSRSVARCGDTVRSSAAVSAFRMALDSVDNQRGVE